MFLTIQSYKSEERKHESAHALSFVCSVLLCLIILTGCDNLNNKQQNSVVKPKGDVTPADVAEMTKPSSNNTVKEVIPYAPTSVKHRIGKWFGGVPPINKRSSGINTYYQLKPTGKPNHLLMRLRFEGITAEDAMVAYRTLDGATFQQKNQQTQWRLKANVVSEVEFTVVVPDSVSYLTLDTFQNNQGASRAFVLALPATAK